MRGGQLSHDPLARARQGRLLRLGLGLALAGGLIAWLLSTTALSDAAVWRALLRHPLEICAIALGAAVLQVFASTAKWRMLLRRATPERVAQLPFRRLFAYTALAALAGQIVPPYIAGPSLRAYALKRQHQEAFAPHAMIAGYEQLFDVIVLVVGGLAALALLLVARDGLTAIVLFGAAIVVAGVVIRVLPRPLRPNRMAGLLPRSWRLTACLRSRIEAGGAAGLDEPRLMGQMMSLSGLRYAVLALRTMLIGLLVLPLVPWEMTILGFAAVQLSALAVLTPGNLGVSEAGWSAMALFSPGAAAGEFVAFALVLRASGLLAGAALAAVSALALRKT